MLGYVGICLSKSNKWWPTLCGVSVCVLSGGGKWLVALGEAGTAFTEMGKMCCGYAVWLSGLNLGSDNF